MDKIKNNAEHKILSQLIEDTDRITIAQTRPIAKNGGIYQLQQVIKRPIEVSLTIGVFFDGTANNYQNTQLRQQYQQALAQGEEPDRKLPVYDTSYLNEFTNVYKLYEMYVDDGEEGLSVADRVDSTDGIRTASYQLKIYIEGPGTETGKPDNTIGLGTGFGETGVMAKNNKALSVIREKLNELRENNPKIRIQSIQYDVFGFSRGAATARYFSNIVADVLKPKDLHGTNNPLTKILSSTLKGKISDYWQGKANGQVRFLGLLDTVAGLCLPTNRFDAGDANTFDVDIKLRPETAQAVLHLEAAHEYRHNFSLNAVPSFFKSLILPGAHSDIGGGYANKDEDEKIYITPLYIKRDLLFHEHNVHLKRLKIELANIQQHPDLTYLFAGVNESNFSIWTKPVRYDNDTNRNEFGVIRFERKVKFGLDRIALRVMYNEAIKQNCRLKIFPTDYEIPQLLKPVANKIIAAASNYQSYALSEQEKQLVITHYVHSSAEYAHGSRNTYSLIDIIDERTGELKKISWQTKQELIESSTSSISVHHPHLNQKGQWQRLIHAN